MKFDEIKTRAHAKEAVALAYRRLGHDASEESIIELATDYMDSLMPHPYCIIIEDEWD